MKAPQVFQGIRAEVIVPESSSILERTLGSNPFFLYLSLNILPGIKMDKYCSGKVALQKIQESTVVNTKLPVVFVKVTNLSSTVSNTLIFSTTPPNAMATIIKETVNIIDCSPPLDNKLSANS